MSNVFTHCNDVDTASSLIDHGVCSTLIDSLICSTDIIGGFVTSDHKPLFVIFNLSCNVLLSPYSADNNVNNNELVDWTRLDDDNLQAYMIIW